MTVSSDILKEYAKLLGKPFGLSQCSLSVDDILIKATFHNDYSLIKYLIDKGEFNQGLMRDAGLFDIPFPLYYITICNQIIFSLSYDRSIMPLVKENRDNIDLILGLWRDKFGVDTSERIDFRKYGDFFYCHYADESLDDVLFAPADKYIENGCRLIDLQLYEAVVKFDFEKVKELLDGGANPDAELLPVGEKDESEACNCMCRIGNECAYLSCEIFPFFKKEFDLWYVNHRISDRDLGQLVGWAANEVMYKTLESYVVS